MSLYYTVNIAASLFVFSLAVKVLLMMKEEGWGAFENKRGDHEYK